MEKEITFKEMMHFSSIKSGKGNIKELIENIGDNGFERLKGMKIILVDSDNNWILSTIGSELVEIFNRKL